MHVVSLSPLLPPNPTRSKIIINIRSNNITNIREENYKEREADRKVLTRCGKGASANKSAERLSAGAGAGADDETTGVGAGMAVAACVFTWADAGTCV